MPARVEERKPPPRVEAVTGDIISGRDGRRIQYRVVTRSEGKRPIRSLSPPAPPRAPSPPRTHSHKLGSDTCPRPDCPLGIRLDDRSPLSDSFRFTASSSTLGSRPIQTTIRVPSSPDPTVPILSPPPLTRRKSLKTEPKRHDSAVRFTSSRSPASDPMEGPSRPRRPRAESNGVDRALAAELASLERTEARRLRFQAEEDARQARLEQDRYLHREALRGRSAEAEREAERARQNAAAQDNARRRAQDVHAAAEHSRMRDAESRAKERERDTAARRTEQRDRYAELSSPESARPRPRQNVVVHQRAESAEDIIRREQDRVAREQREQVRSGQPYGQRILHIDGPYEDDDDLDLSTNASRRRRRMRRYRDEYGP